eukprot:COSAG01_NODE_2851_length_6937_cov_13.682228_7_plen_59_part_00
MRTLGELRRPRFHHAAQLRLALQVRKRVNIMSSQKQAWQRRILVKHSRQRQGGSLARL